MDANAELLTAALEDDPTAELFSDASDSAAPDLASAPEPVHARPAPSTPAASTPTVPTSIEPAPGVVLRERYVLEEPIAAGGTAIVYRARDLRRDAAAHGGGQIAVKFLRPEKRRRPQAIESLRREFQLAQTLSHPNIARVFDLDCESGLWFLTVELLEGESLAALLKQSGEPLATRRALDILRACGEALAFAHDRGVVHGDFKPGNVFIARNGQVRVLDFGAAAASWQARDPRVTAVTPRYASPQVLTGERPERRDDVFSFACVAYELLNGRHPFGHRSSLDACADNVEIARPWNLSPRQWHALEGALSWESEQRPATLRALVTELTSSEVPAPLVIPEISVEARTFRAPALAPIAGVLALAVLAVIGLVIAYAQLDQDQAVAANAEAIAAQPPILEALPAERVIRTAAVLPVAANTVREAAPPAARASVANAPARTESRLPALISIDAPQVLVSEGAVAAVLRLDRRQQLNGRVHVKWRTLAGSAEPGKDFAPISGTAEFADGQTTRAIYIPLLNDRLAERDETFTVELYESGDGTRIDPTARAQATIRDDDRD